MTGQSKDPSAVSVGVRTHSAHGRDEGGWAVYVVLGGRVADPSILLRGRMQLYDSKVEGSNQPFHRVGATFPFHHAEPMDFEFERGVHRAVQEVLTRPGRPCTGGNHRHPWRAESLLRSDGAGKTFAAASRDPGFALANARCGTRILSRGGARCRRAEGNRDGDGERERPPGVGRAATWHPSKSA